MSDNRIDVMVFPFELCSASAQDHLLMSPLPARGIGSQPSLEGLDVNRVSAFLSGAAFLPPGVSHRSLTRLAMRSWMVGSAGGLEFVWFPDKSRPLQTVPGTETVLVC